MASRDLSEALLTVGLRQDLSPWKRPWSELKNVLVKDGAMRKRPGFHPVGNMSANISNFEPSAALWISDIFNPGSDDVGRGTTFIAETIRPDSNGDVVAGWAGAFGDIDDVVPDSTDTVTTGMISSTTGAITSIGFPDLTNTLDPIFGFVLRGRARLNLGADSKLRGYNSQIRFRASEATNLRTVFIGGLIGGNDGEGTIEPQWIYFTVPFLFKDLAGTSPWTNQLINTMTFTMEMLDATMNSSLLLVPDQDGTLTEWDKSSSAAGSEDAVFGDFDNISALSPEEISTTDIITTQTVGKKQEWKISPHVVSTDVISGMGIRVLLRTVVPIEHPEVRVYYKNPSGTEFTLGTVIANSTDIGTSTGWWQNIPVGGTNPDTGNTWTFTEIHAAVFGIEYMGGNAFPFIHGVNILITSETASTHETHIDYLAIDVLGLSNSLSSTSDLPDHARVWGTKPGHWRLNSEITIATINEITNSVGWGSTAPIEPYDHAQLYGQLFVVNGVEATRRYPNSANTFDALTTNDADESSFITGRTVMAFGNRILYGWTTESTGATPERIHWSNIRDGSKHNKISSGFLDLLGTPGGLVKLIPLNEDVGVALKEKGIYTLRLTGNSDIPFLPDQIDYETQCLAKMTAQRIKLPGGTPAIIFLGADSGGGRNVFVFDGSQTIAVGDGIAPDLDSELNSRRVSSSFGGVDPQSGYYWLFVARGSEMFPQGGYVFNLKTSQWYEFTSDLHFTCAGNWKVMNDLQTGGTGLDNPGDQGKDRMVVGLSDGTVTSPRLELAQDTITPSTNDNSAEQKWTFMAVTARSASGGLQGGPMRTLFTSVIESGDHRPAIDSPQGNYLAYRVNTVSRGHRIARTSLSMSSDGGESFNTAIDSAIGDFVLPDGQIHQVVEANPDHSSRLRFKLSMGPEDANKSQMEELFEIYEMWLNFEPGGETP